MKVSIGTNIKDGPWGGGNLFAINLKNYLESNKHKVVNNLDEDDIDLILLTEPRRTSESSSFTHIDILKYRQFVKRDVVVVHRINECDERKNTNFVNQYLIEANKSADATVFVSNWLKELFLEQGLNCEKISVIMSGANNKIFYDQNKKKFDNKTLNLVTHHWGANWNKGFEIYQLLDEYLEDDDFRSKYSFTYIGNLPNKFRFKNTRLVEPLSGSILADEIRKNDVYLTASLNEPSGNHHIEGAQCGLPILFIDSGGVSEYCKEFGVMFNKYNLKEKLDEIFLNYSSYKEKMNSYPNNSDIMCKNYMDLFENLIEEKNDLMKNRKTPNLINFFEKLIYSNSRRLKKFINKSD